MSLGGQFKGMEREANNWKSPEMCYVVAVVAAWFVTYHWSEEKGLLHVPFLLSNEKKQPRTYDVQLSDEFDQILNETSALSIHSVIFGLGGEEMESFHTSYNDTLKDFEDWHREAYDFVERMNLPLSSLISEWRDGSYESIMSLLAEHRSGLMREFEKALSQLVDGLTKAFEQTPIKLPVQ